MIGESEVDYVPLGGASLHAEQVERLPFTVGDLAVTGLVIECDLDDPVRHARRPSMNIKITQYLRLADRSLIRLDMDRGLSFFKHGYQRPVSWKQSTPDFVAEVLTIVKADAPDPADFPWEEYAQTARLRRIAINADQISQLPCQVLISDQLAAKLEL
ncbi:hypothetical protein [Haematomicrobium sanguinis]|uniref:hypothetical protein n=1 Tax=Haematomicrobium sanguinis TaxID=479106 RepID=UPI00047B619C|nr:hypothetical protein [Haematomicrobium sanguinis]